MVLDRLAGQLQIADPSCVKRYTERRTTPFEHRDEIKAAYGLREFPEAEAEFAQWVRSRAWNTGQGPKAMFTDGVQWLRANAVLLPGVTTLARVVARVRFSDLAVAFGGAGGEAISLRPGASARPQKVERPPTFRCAAYLGYGRLCSALTRLAPIEFERAGSDLFQVPASRATGLEIEGPAASAAGLRAVGRGRE